MRKRIGLACAMVLMFLGAASSMSPARANGIHLGITTAVVYYCPELPADCCIYGWDGHCKVCVRGGC